MENDDLSRFEKVLDDKNSSSSKFFMPDNFYDEKADAMRDSSINHMLGIQHLNQKSLKVLVLMVIM